MPRGQLILIEGLDRSGKSTQASLLASKFPQNKLIKFPNRSTPIGQLINEYLTNKQFELNDQAAHLLFSANRWELAAEIESLLNSGVFVVLDRYIYSGVAYTLAKNHADDDGTITRTATGDDKNESKSNSRSLADADWLLGPDKGLPKPDLTLFLTLDMDEISQRKGWGDERYEMVQFQAKVKNCFLRVLDTAGDPTIEVVGVGHMSIEQVAQLLWDKVEIHNANVLTDASIEYI
ncbi:uncharacterized protein LODBEIA_P07440 [Lodderomyces beijingensis]|uniref:dTMP kinase n=1 Tax=Lodderomyces beijingensis TaxID=1775926 RepID=A0ABP0ZED1_9ASCO